MTIGETREYKEKKKAQSASGQKAAKEKLSEMYELRKMQRVTLSYKYAQYTLTKNKNSMM